MSDKIDNKAFEEDRADELLRDTMKGYRVEPRPGLWRDISRKLLWRELLRFNFTNLSPGSWISGSAGLILIIATIYLGVPGTAPDHVATHSAPSGNITRTTYTAGNHVKSSASGNIAASNIKNNGQSGEKYRSNQSLQADASGKSGLEGRQKPNLSDPFPANKSNEALMAESMSMDQDKPGLNQSYSREEILPVTSGVDHILPFETVLVYSPGQTDTIITINNPSGIVKFRKDSPSSSRFFSATLGITPELAFYSEPDEYSETNFWLNGGITCHVSRFSIASGFALGYVYDEGQYQVDYKSKDSIGFFNSVISYEVGSNNEIIYQTRTLNVYDSLNHHTDFRTRNRYSYLQIPMLLGYRFFETNRISMTFQAGPAVALLLGSRNSDPVIEYSNATIIRVDDDTPVRVMANWQVWANIFFEMRVNKKVSIYLEPSFKYYLKPMVTQENVTFNAPWTIGMGVGLQFNFGQKKTGP
jgi:hypothetical protein